MAAALKLGSDLFRMFRAVARKGSDPYFAAGAVPNPARIAG